MSDWSKGMSEAIKPEALRGAVGGVLCNAMNFPDRVIHHVLGEDMRPLIDRVVDAVLAALSTQPAAGEVLTVVEWGEALITDDEPETYQLRKGPWSEAQPVDEGYAFVRRVAQYTPWTEVQS